MATIPEEAAGAGAVETRDAVAAAGDGTTTSAAVEQTDGADVEAAFEEVDVVTGTVAAAVVEEEEEGTSSVDVEDGAVDRSRAKASVSISR